MLSLVSSANIACGGHAGDPETMFATLRLAAERGVAVGAHPGFADREGFGRRVIPMSPPAIGRMVAAQIGALLGIGRLSGTGVRYVKPHGALANLAADDQDVAAAIAGAVGAISADLAVLAISGTLLEEAARAAGLRVFSEVVADRGDLASGRLVPRGHDRAMIHDPDEAAERMIAFLASGLMPTIDGPPVRLAAQSICVHGDGPQAVAMATTLRARLERAGLTLAPFAGD